MATIFLSVGSGAVVQVVISLHKAILANAEERIWTPLTASGLMAGLMIMYATGLLVAI